MTNNGKYLFCHDSRGLHRFRIDGTTIEYEEAGPQVGKDWGRIVFSPDSKYVALLPGLPHNFPSMEGHPIKPIHTVFIYNVNDLGKPVTSYCSGKGNTLLGFDRAAKLLYADKSKHQFVTVALSGVVMREYRLDERIFNYGIQVHTTGKKLLLISNKKLLWVILQ
ncbi:MAG: hypothetical protein GY765_17135 [bacterium]|nr:hypothetical protein [bacterium]